MRLIAALAALVAFPAFAATVSVSWTNPVAYVDNTPLAAVSITRTRIEYGTCSAPGVFGVRTGEFISAGNDTTEVSPNLPAGTYCFRAYTTASGVESAASNVDDTVILQAAPRPPTLGQLIVAWLRSVMARFA